VICDHGLATKNILQMLLSTEFCIGKVDGLPDSDGQLQTITDIYHIDIHCMCTPIFTLFPCITTVHSIDTEICIPPDIIIGKQNGTVQGNKKKSEWFGVLQKSFNQELAKSYSNCAGCKHYVPGSFIAF